ncbi:hypothetical protein [Kurthia huakuii]|uniref:hypothetical protein n=1 Tax=Kurthia huakuii TaxID=1421019 RepID=UPI000496B8E8|nr:hypothetical protein [Kurthia huakuii]MBM7698825.1 hypothetical protein [Kurthia huakuii]
MGKHKIVKSAAAVALTASVVATAVAPGASAASYKTNSKDQLVYTKSGKLVKGWKVFGGKLYKNGKLAPAKKYKIIGTGAAQQLFYGPTLKKGYKTANSKTLLFKDGKLADGWKQAGKGERLYKNGKLDKGYTVFNDVEGEKFLYQNGYLKKGLKTATRGGETNLFKDGKLAQGLVQFPAETGKFYNNGKLAQGTIGGKEYKDGVVVVAEANYTAKSINATTVEVTFETAIDTSDVKAENFAIEGLTVSNAVAKQSDSKTVILTTSAQEAGKEYSVAYKGATAAKFTAINTTVPTAIASTTIKPYQTSQQAKIGTQVTVKATVTVAEGQSKAGIPVTFVIDNNKDVAGTTTGNQGKDQTVEVKTDENGVASYTYTQYVDSTDSVTAYATGAPTQRTSTFVYWGIAQPLTVADVTTESTLANNGKKVYKVTGERNAEYSVTFAENYNVTPEKVDNKAKINDEPVSPFQSSISGEAVASKVVKIKTNDKGEATFSVTGANTSVTPVVFKESILPVDRLNPAELQATASTVKFENIKTVGLTNEAQGTQKASAAKAGTTFEKMKENQGGRTYVSTLTDKDGKTAAAGTTVYLTFDKGATTNPVSAANLHVFDAKGNAVTADANGVYTLKTDKDGKVVYALSSATQNSYATPVVFLNNGTSTGLALDEADTNTKGEITYFGDATVAKAELKVNKQDAANGLTVKYAKDVTVNYQTVDQNGFEYAPEKETKVAFNFTTTFGELTAGSVVVATGNTNNKALEFTTNPQGEIEFKLGTDVDTTATVTASGNTVVANNATAKVVFEYVGAAPTASVTEAEKDAVNRSGSAAEVKTALAANESFKSLSTEAQDKFAKEVYEALKAGNPYTVASLNIALTKAMNDDKPVTPSATAKAYTDAVAAIPALKEDKSNKADVAAAIAKAEEAAKALTAADKATTAVKDADAKLAAAKESVKEETPEGDKVKVADLLAAKKATIDTDKVTDSVTLSFLKTDLPASFEGKKVYAVVKGEKVEIKLSALAPTKYYNKFDSKFTQADVEAAELIAE